MSEQRYSEERAKEILKRAVDLQADASDIDFTRAQLEEMARDLGISTESLVRAEQAVQAEEGTRAEREVTRKELDEFERYRRRAFLGHAASYIIVNTFLFILNLVLFFTTDSPFWFMWPLLGWGMGLAGHWWSTQQKEGEAYEQQLAQWRSTRRLTTTTRPRLPG